MNNRWVVSKLTDTMKRSAAITMDDNGNIYFVTKTDNVFQMKLDAENPQPNVIAHAKGADLRGIAYSRNNKVLYLCDSKNKILSYSMDSGKIDTLCGDKERYDGKFKDISLCTPRRIFMDDKNCLYVAQPHSIQKLDVDEGTVTVVAGSYESGHSDGPAVEAQFYGPFGVAVSEAGITYVADWGNHCIRKIKHGMVSTLAGIPGKSGKKDGLFHEAQFTRPIAILLHTDGTLFIGDSTGLRILNLHQQTVTTVKNVPQSVWSLTRDTRDPWVLYSSHQGAIYKLVNPWQWQRWLWLGYLKEKECPLSTLPREIIREISSHFQ